MNAHRVMSRLTELNLETNEVLGEINANLEAGPLTHRVVQLLNYVGPTPHRVHNGQSRGKDRATMKM